MTCDYKCKTQEPLPHTWNIDQVANQRKSVH
jgi:hypothetical protein